MSGPVFRSIAAVSTLGLSETAQKKPFQNFGGDNPVSSMAGGPLRFIPGGAQIAGLMAVNQDAMKKEVAPATPPASPLQVKDNKAEQAEDLARQRGGKGRVSNMLTSPDAVASSGVPQLRPFLGGF